MKRLRQICAVTVLTIVFANVAAAEEGISHPWVVPPMPPSATSNAHSGATPINDAEAKSEESTIDLATEIALRLIQNMLALF